MSSSNRIEGVVKWWQDSKGFGFLSTQDFDNIFVHYTQITDDGFKTLVDGQSVTFELINGPKGLQAANVKKEVTK